MGNYLDGDNKKIDWSVPNCGEGIRKGWHFYSQYRLYILAMNLQLSRLTTNVVDRITGKRSFQYPILGFHIAEIFMWSLVSIVNCRILAIHTDFVLTISYCSLS